MLLAEGDFRMQHTYTVNAIVATFIMSYNQRDCIRVDRMY